MATWLHIPTKKVYPSISRASLPVPIVECLENPDLSVVVGQPNKYWVISGDAVSLMDRAARDAVDAVLEQEKIDRERAVSKDQVEDDRFAIALAIVLADDFGSGLTARQIKDRLNNAIDNG